MLTPDERIALDMLADPEAYTRSLHRNHDAVLSGKPAAEPLRSLISDSWRRCLAARVNPDAKAAPIVQPAAAVERIRAAHPLAVGIPILQQTLLSIAEKAQHVVVVTDAQGMVLWCDGARSVRRDAERISLVEGALCSEEALGTNAMGTALAIGAPVQIHSAEHLVRTLQTWTCAASPVHDPETGAILGIIDISGPVRSAHPSSAVLVSATAQLVEHKLRVHLAKRETAWRARYLPHLQKLRGDGGALLSPTGRVLATDGIDALPTQVPVESARVSLGDGREGILEPLAEGYLLRLSPQPTAPARPALSLSLLGAAPPAAVVNGQHVSLTYRHAEIVALLAIHPAGLSADQLTFHLYGDAGSPVTARSEIHRLRGHLGGEVLRTRPYRLNADVSADFLAVRGALRNGDPHRAMRSYRGVLLPRSESPAIRDERDELHAAIRRAVLDSRDAELLWTLADADLGRDDLELLDALDQTLRPDDPRRAIAAARTRRLLTDDL